LKKTTTGQGQLRPKSPFLPDNRPRGLNSPLIHRATLALNRKTTRPRRPKWL